MPKDLSGLRPWKKGECGNPKGRPPLGPEMRAIRRMTNQEVAELGTLLLEGNMSGIRDIQKNPDKHSVLKVLVASMIVTCINDGDAALFNAIMDRICGKVRDRLQVEGGIGVVHFTPQQIREIAELALETEVVE